MKLRLYHYWRSTSSWRVRWAFALKKIECEKVAINLLTDESDSSTHRARNPMGYVPVLEILDEPADSRLRFLAESTAIIEWAEERFPTPSLLPGNAEERARIRQLAELVNSGIQPLQNLSVLEHFSSDPQERKRWAQHWIRKGLNSYEELIRGVAGQYSFGNTVTLADLFLIPQCYGAIRQEIDLGREFPTIAGIYERALKTEACAASHPDRFKPEG